MRMILPGGSSLLLGFVLLLLTSGTGKAGEVPPRPVLTDAVENAPDANGIYHIRFEAESAKIIEPSFKVKNDLTCSNGKYVSLPEGAGSAWTKSGVGRLEYEVKIPVAGEYALWGRCKWENGCSSQLYIDLAGAKPVSRNRGIYIMQVCGTKG